MAIQTGITGLGGNQIAPGQGAQSFAHHFQQALANADQPAAEGAAHRAPPSGWENRSRRILRALADETRGTGRYVKLVGTTNRRGTMRLIYLGRMRHWFSFNQKRENTNTALLEMARAAFKDSRAAEQSEAFNNLRTYLERRRTQRRAPRTEALRPYLRALLRELSSPAKPSPAADPPERIAHALADDDQLGALKQQLVQSQASIDAKFLLQLARDADKLVTRALVELRPGTMPGPLKQRVTHLLRDTATLTVPETLVQSALESGVRQPGQSSPTTLALDASPLVVANWVERGEQLALRVEAYRSFAVIPPTDADPLDHTFLHDGHVINPVEQTLGRQKLWCVQATLRTRVAVEVPLPYLQSPRQWPPAVDEPAIRVISAEADLRLGAPERWLQPPVFGETFPSAEAPESAGILLSQGDEGQVRHRNRAYNALIRRVRDAVPGGLALPDIECEHLSVRAAQRLSAAERGRASLIAEFEQQSLLDARREFQAEAVRLSGLQDSVAGQCDPFAARFTAEASVPPQASNPLNPLTNEAATREFLNRLDEAETKHNDSLADSGSGRIAAGFLRSHFGALLAPPVIDLQRPRGGRPLVLVGDADGSLLRLALAAWSAGYWQPGPSERDLLCEVAVHEGAAMHAGSAKSLAEFQRDPKIAEQLLTIATALDKAVREGADPMSAPPDQQLVFLGDILFDRLSNQATALETVIRALHQRGAVFLRGNHECVMAEQPDAQAPIDVITAQWGGYAYQRFDPQKASQLLADCFVNAWADETQTVLLTHNGFFYDPRSRAWHTGIGSVAAYDASGALITVDDFVRILNTELGDALVSTNFRPKAALQGIDQPRPRNARGPVPWVAHGHDGHCGLNAERGVLNLNARSEAAMIAASVQVP